MTREEIDQFFENLPQEWYDDAQEKLSKAKYAYSGWKEKLSTDSKKYGGMLAWTATIDLDSDCNGVPSVMGLADGSVVYFKSCILRDDTVILYVDREKSKGNIVEHLGSYETVDIYLSAICWVTNLA